MKFPWEKEADTPTISDDEIAELQAEMEALNEYYAQEQVSP